MKSSIVKLIAYFLLLGTWVAYGCFTSSQSPKTKLTPTTVIRPKS